MMGLGDVLFTYSIKEGGGPEWQNEYIENSQLCRSFHRELLMRFIGGTYLNLAVL